MKKLAYILGLAFALNLSAQQAVLTWTDNSTNETGFRIQRAPVSHL